MSDQSAIEWTDATWNPVRGCTKVSPGCKSCYAEAFAERWRGVPGHAYEQGFDLRLVPEKLEEPLRWERPRRVFVNSMADLFHEGVADSYIAAAFGVMASAERHTFQILTKRAERLPQWFAWVEKREQQGTALFPEDSREWRIWQMLYVAALKLRAKPPPHHGGSWPLPNVWLGVSVEDRRHGLPRIEHLRATPAALRFLSVEPLLEDLGPIDLTGIGWVILGGESGPGARICHLTWLRNVVRQCDAQRVPVFVKQLGSFPVGPGAPVQIRRSKGGDMNTWPADLAGRRAFPSLLKRTS